MNHHRAARLGNRSQHCRLVERGDSAQIDDFDRHALPRQHLGCGQCIEHCLAIGDDRRVASRARDRRLAERHAVAGRGCRSLDAVAQDILDHDDRVVILDRGGEQAIGIGRVGRHHDAQARHMREPRFQHVAMLTTEAHADTGRRPDHQRDMSLPARHEAQLRRVIDDLVHRHRHEVHQHDLGHRPQARDRRAHGRADDRLFRDRCRADTVLAIFGAETGGDLEHPAALLIADIFAQRDDILVRRHRFVECHVQALGEADLAAAHAACSAP